MANDFKLHLKSVASDFAAHEQVDSVSMKHVNEAYSALARLGLTSRRWYKRAESETALGGILAGLSASANDLVALVFKETSIYAQPVSICLFLVLAIFGAALFFHGLHRSTIAMPPGS